MVRKLYTLTEKQLRKAAESPACEMPSDDEFKAQWKKSHHGKLTGWGMGKATWIKRQMKNDPEYVREIGRAHV